eukprot:766680-Hanusia_phi.AAC.9
MPSGSMHTAVCLAGTIVLLMLEPGAAWSNSFVSRMCVEQGEGDYLRVTRRNVITAAKFAVPTLHLLAPREVPAADQTQLASFKTSVPPAGLKFVDVREGSGEQVKLGDRVSFHYIGRLAGRQGKPFEDTYSDEPVRVELGKTRVIKGLVAVEGGRGGSLPLNATRQEEGLLGMREGGKRRLLIPSSLGYHDK